MNVIKVQNYTFYFVWIRTNQVWTKSLLRPMTLRKKRKKVGKSKRTKITTLSCQLKKSLRSPISCTPMTTMTTTRQTMRRSKCKSSISNKDWNLLRPTTAATSICREDSSLNKSSTSGTFKKARNKIWMDSLTNRTTLKVLTWCPEHCPRASFNTFWLTRLTRLSTNNTWLRVLNELTHITRRQSKTTCALCTDLAWSKIWVAALECKIRLHWKKTWFRRRSILRGLVSKLTCRHRNLNRKGERPRDKELRVLYLRGIR